MTPGKRALDVVASFAALSVFSPVLIGAAVAIKLEDGGPVLFLQERIGKDGVPFTVFKVRTMRDGSITRVGAWLRRTGIDEIAQFLNVLRGEMSVVGPRPLTRADLERLGWEHDAIRASMEPGITGPAQVYGGQGAAVSLGHDHAYAAGASLVGDVRFIAISFAINLVGKQRVREWLRGRGRGNERGPELERERG